MKCQDFRELIDSYLSDELLTETNHDVLRHLEQCANCRYEIEVHRKLLLQLRSAVKNSPQYQIRDEFARNLRAQLRKNTSSKNIFWTARNSWMAVAAMFVITLGSGFWFIQNRNLNSTGIVHINEDTKSVFLENAALGDHQNCAVKYNLSDKPIDIDLASAKYADLRQAVLLPLQNAPEKYELLESHICKYGDHTFTHIVFGHQGKTVSVLLTDLQNYEALKDEEIIKVAANGYQLAHFDTKYQAVFVVSNLSQKENSAITEMLANPARKYLSNYEPTKLTLLAKLR